jgi:hypothetical protein
MVKAVKSRIDSIISGSSKAACAVGERKITVPRSMARKVELALQKRGYQTEVTTSTMRRSKRKSGYVNIYFARSIL